MKKTSLIILIIIFGVVPVCKGKVSTKVCLADGITPLEPIEVNLPIIKYPGIVVGTKLTIYVWSDVNEPWLDGGCLAIEEQYWDYGILSARGPKVGEDWTGSHFPAAGDEAVVWKCVESGIDGFYLYSGSTEDVEAGSWFIIDYNSIGVGCCNVGFYNYNINWDEPIQYLSFSHVPTRDFNKDTKVDFADFAMLASYWQEKNCGDANNCEGTDLDIDGDVDVNDLMLFTEYWLYKTE